MGVARVCVLCRRNPVEDRWSPFCSERCRNQDLANWAGGTYRIAADPLPSADDLEPLTPSDGTTDVDAAH
jgi:hypothetical protein